MFLAPSVLDTAVATFSLFKLINLPSESFSPTHSFTSCEGYQQKKHTSKISPSDIPAEETKHILRKEITETSNDDVYVL